MGGSLALSLWPPGRGSPCQEAWRLEGSKTSFLEGLVRFQRGSGNAQNRRGRTRVRMWGRQEGAARRRPHSAPAPSLTGIPASSRQKQWPGGGTSGAISVAALVPPSAARAGRMRGREDDLGAEPWAPLLIRLACADAVSVQRRQETA